MEQNSLEKKITAQNEEKPHRSGQIILKDVLEEIPEMDTVNHSEILQIVLIPLAAVLLVVLIPLLLSSTSFRRTETPLARDFPYVSLESEILQNAVKDIRIKREELNQKDLTIRQYEDRIQTMGSNLRIIQELMEDSLQLREEALQVEIETILLEEKTRLLALGQTEVEVERALERLKSGLESDYEDRMEDFRVRELSTYQNRLDSMKTERNNLMKALETAVGERKALAQTLENSESNLLAEVYDQPEYAKVEENNVKAELEILRNVSRTQNYWLDELANQYLGLFNTLAIRNYEGANAHISALESMFSNEMINRLPGFEARNEADQEIVRFMASYLSVQSVSEMEKLLIESRALIERAENHANEGRLNEATEAWAQLETLWPLLGQAIVGSRLTQDITTARELRRYANLAEISLASGDYEEAALVWESGLERMSEPLGQELERWWTTWNDSEAQRRADTNFAITELIVSYEERLDLVSAGYQEQLAREATGYEEQLSRQADRHEEQLNREAAAYQDKLGREAAENQILRDQIAEQESGVTPITETESPNQELRDSLAIAETRISVLESEIRALEERLAEARVEEIPESINQPTTTTQWFAYGTVIQIIGESLVINPIIEIVPPVGSDIRIRRSLGGDRVIHLADGFLLETNPTRAIASISSSSSGAEIYGSPQVGDLVYVVVPVPK